MVITLETFTVIILLIFIISTEMAYFFVGVLKHFLMRKMA